MNDEITNLAGTFDDVLKIFRKYVYFHDQRYAIVCTAWVIHTWWLDRFYTSPRLLVTSARPGCGKTQLGEVLKGL